MEPDALHETIEAWYDDPVAAGYAIETRIDPFLVPTLWGMEDFYRIALASGADHDTMIDAMILTEYAVTTAHREQIPFDLVARNVLEIMNASERERRYYSLIHPRDETHSMIKARIHLNVARSTLMITVLEPIFVKFTRWWQREIGPRWDWWQHNVSGPFVEGLREGFGEIKSMFDKLAVAILTPVNRCLTGAVSYLKRRRKEREQ